jgi:hypothetical protein
VPTAFCYRERNPSRKCYSQCFFLSASLPALYLLKARNGVNVSSPTGRNSERYFDLLRLSGGGMGWSGRALREFSANKLKIG